MRKRRFFVHHLPTSLQSIALPPDAAHHAVDVLRLDEGAEIELFDGEGHKAIALLRRGSPAMADIQSLAADKPAGVAIDVAVPLIKGDRQDWLVEKLTELGVRQLLPLICERGIINELSSNKRERYERLVLAACRQSGRSSLMRIGEPVALAALPAEGVLALDPYAEASFAEVVAKNTAQSLCLVIGPEGGLTERELAYLQTKGAQTGYLATPILRTETAALAASAICVGAAILVAP